MWQVATGISVTFDKNGGDTEADPNRRVQEQNPNGNHFELPSVQPTREGYEFTGWNTKADGTGAAFTAETEVKQSLTVYAQWARKQTEIAVTFDKNGGDTEADPRMMTQKVDEERAPGLNCRASSRRAKGMNLRAGTPKQTERARCSRRKPK